MKFDQLKFFEIKDPVMVRKILDASFRYKIRITGWLKDQAIRHETYIAYVFEEQSKLFLKPPSDIAQKKLLIELIPKLPLEYFGTLEIDRMPFFFKTKLVHVDLGARNIIQVDSPASLFKLQRRAHLRIPFLRTQAPKVWWFDPKLFVNVLPDFESDKSIPVFRSLDISAGGIAVAAHVKDRDKFAPGTRLTTLHFKLKGETIYVDGIVAHVSEIKSDQGKTILKVGLKFVDLKPRYDQIISQYVMEESRRAFSMLY